MNTHNQKTEINGTDLVFKNQCPDHMKNYIYFLHDHHGYKWDSLKSTFSEYFNQQQKNNLISF